ncbi:MAG: Arc/MetJ family transcription regulator [Arcticibacterium sp.]|jgi:Arc/MetJ family transcription regulator
MRTTIDLPENLLTLAMKATNSKTKVEAIKKALEEVIKLEQRKKMLNYRGKIDLNADLDILRDRKELT